MNKLSLTLLLALLLFLQSPTSAINPEAPEACSACKVFVPNAFSPNADGTNDIFKPETACEILSYQLRIYNRWGNLVFLSESIDQGWNGEIKGQAAAADVYVYVLQYTVATDDESDNQVVTGDLALLR